jgi:hypothetical protein
MTKENEIESYNNCARNHSLPSNGRKDRSNFRRDFTTDMAVEKTQNSKARRILRARLFNFTLVNVHSATTATDTMRRTIDFTYRFSNVRRYWKIINIGKATSTNPKTMPNNDIFITIFSK